MNHPITLGGLLAGLGAFGAVVLIAFGLLMIFAGGMSDAPEAGDATASSGCLALVGGVFLLMACLGALL